MPYQSYFSGSNTTATPAKGGGYTSYFGNKVAKGPSADELKATRAKRAQEKTLQEAKKKQEQIKVEAAKPKSPSLFSKIKTFTNENVVQPTVTAGQKTVNTVGAGIAGVGGLTKAGVQAATGNTAGAKKTVIATNKAIDTRLDKGTGGKGGFLTSKQAKSTGGGAKSLKENFIKPTAQAVTDVAPLVLPFGAGKAGSLLSRVGKSAAANAGVSGAVTVSNQAIQGRVGGKEGAKETLKGLVQGAVLGAAIPLAGRAGKVAGEKTTGKVAGKVKAATGKDVATNNLIKTAKTNSLLNQVKRGSDEVPAVKPVEKTNSIPVEVLKEAEAKRVQIPVREQTVTPVESNLYHGTYKGNKFQQFDVSKSGAGNRGKGIYLTDNPEAAKYYSHLADKNKQSKDLLSNPDLSRQPIEQLGEVHTVSIKGSKLAELDHPPSPDEMLELQRQGYDGARFKEDLLGKAEDIPSKLVDRSKLGNANTTVLFNGDKASINTPQTQIELEPLAQEARKYKTADDFVKAYKETGAKLDSQVKASLKTPQEKAAFEMFGRIGDQIQPHEKSTQYLEYHGRDDLYKKLRDFHAQVQPKGTVDTPLPKPLQDLQNKLPEGYKVQSDGVVIDPAGKEANIGKVQELTQDKFLTDFEHASAKGDRATMQKIADAHPGDKRVHIGATAAPPEVQADLTPAQNFVKGKSLDEFNNFLTTNGGSAKKSQIIQAITKQYGNTENFWRAMNGKEQKVSFSSGKLGLNSQPTLKAPQPKQTAKPTSAETPTTSPELQAIREAKPKDTKSASRVYNRLKAEHPELKDDVSYDAIQLKKDAEKAVELLAKDKQQAYRVAMGAESLPDQTSTGVNIAMAEKALDEGNYNLYGQLIKNRSLAQTRRGQELVAEKGSISDNSTSRYVKELLSMRMDKLGKKYLGDVSTDLKKISGKERAGAIIDKEVAKVEKRIKTRKLDTRTALAMLDRLECL